MPTQLENISEGLSMMAPAMGGMGAGLQGNLPQFEQMQMNKQVMADRSQEQDQQAKIARMQTMYTDAAAALPMAQRGDYENVIKLGINRLELLKNYPDADPSDTQRITQLAIAAKNGSEEAAELLEAELSSATQAGMDLGIIQRPKRAAAVTDAGKLAQDFENGYINLGSYQEGIDSLKADRKTEQDANGFLRFVDNGERVFPELEQIQETLTGTDRLNQAKSIRSEIDKANGDFNDIANSWDRIAASASEPSAAGDLALIFNFMKMLDPGSTVREGEFATAQNAAGVPTRIQASYNRLMTGERLAQTQRKDFFNQAQNIFNKSSERANQITDEYVRIAEKAGLSRDEVVVDRGAAPDISGIENSLNGQYPTITTPQERDALPAGSEYMMNGILYRKG